MLTSKLGYDNSVVRDWARSDVNSKERQIFLSALSLFVCLYVAFKVKTCFIVTNVLNVKG